MTLQCATGVFSSTIMINYHFPWWSPKGKKWTKIAEYGPGFIRLAAGNRDCDVAGDRSTAMPFGDKGSVLNPVGRVRSHLP